MKKPRCKGTAFDEFVKSCNLKLCYITYNKN